ncbi:MAG: hypothetical protein AB1898_14550 [Acidobacteriota bacterium]
MKQKKAQLGFSGSFGNASQKGYALGAVMVVTAVVLVTLSGALLNWQKAMQREREEELIFRGKQFMRAIELWQRKFPGTYPTTIDALLNTNNIRFLRKKWKDPITNSEEWRLIKLNPDGSLSGLTVIPSGDVLGSGTPAPFSGGPTSPSAPSSGLARTSPAGAQPGAPGQSRSFPGASNRQPQSLQGSTMTSGRSPILGGIVGIASTSEKESLKTYNGRNKYNEWEFYYVPRPQGPQQTPQTQPQQPGTPTGTRGPATTIQPPRQ